MAMDGSSTSVPDRRVGALSLPDDEADHHGEPADTDRQLERTLVRSLGTDGEQSAIAGVTAAGQFRSTTNTPHPGSRSRLAQDGNRIGRQMVATRPQDTALWSL